MLNSTLTDKGLFRVKDWWWSKAALLMGMVYLFTAWFNIGFKEFLPLALLSISTISGFASFGYLLNDFFDREKDLKAGKKNFLAGKSSGTIVVLFLISLSFMLLPWLRLPFNNISMMLIAAEIFSFIVYSLPPFRLKERGIAGLVVDAIYAHALPVALAAYTFSLAAEQSLLLLPVIMLSAWQILCGTRNILLHQADDIKQDKISRAKNFVAQIFPNPFFRVIGILILLELLSSVIFFSALISANLPLASTLIAIMLLGAGIFFLWFFRKGVERLFNSKWKFFPNIIYERWLPPACLILLSTIDRRFVGVLLLHLVLFNLNFFVQVRNYVIHPIVWPIPGILINIRIWLESKRAAIAAASAFIVNHTIYYCFLIFGVDLKKENSSALGYLKKHWKTKHG